MSHYRVAFWVWIQEGKKGIGGKTGETQMKSRIQLIL